MPDITSDEILLQRHKRNFIQFGGAGPANQVRFAGQNAQYISIEGVSAPEIGGIDPIWVPDPRRVGSYKLVGRSYTPPDLPTASVIMRERHGSIPMQLARLGCQFNLYEVSGVCNELSDFLNGWSDYVLIYSGAVVGDKDLGSRSGFDSDDAIEDTLSVTLSDIYPIGSLSFGEGAVNEIDKAVNDVVYQSRQSCGSCGPADDGTNRIYAITKPSGAGSPGLPSELIYTLDGGLTWNQTSITGIGATEEAIAIEIVGSYVVVLGDGAYYYAALNSVTGAPGTFTKVTIGFVAAHKPKDVYVASPREVYFSAAGGYIYRSTDITAGVTVINAASATASDLNRIHGADDTIVAVGASGTVIKSVNRGTTFAAVTTAPAGTTSITAIAVIDSLRYWVGTSTGYVYYTTDGGETWAEKTFSGCESGQIWDIVFATNEVGYISHSTSTPAARILGTWDGGYSWSSSTPRLVNLPTFDHAYRIAVPREIDPSISANNVAVGGLAGDGSDGIIMIGVATRL